ncbi:MAG: NUDIX domain-containing protein [Sphingobium sp.]
MRFEDSYIGRLRRLAGSATLIVPGFRALIFDKDGALLVMRRADTGLWGLHGGSMELGESAAQMIEREVREETSLRAGGFDIFGLASQPDLETHVYPNGDRIHNFARLAAIHHWTSHHCTGTPTALDGEATDFRFVTKVEDIPSVQRVEQEMRCVAPYREYVCTGSFQLL